MAKKPILRMHEQIIPTDNHRCFYFKIGNKTIGSFTKWDNDFFILNVNNQSVCRFDLRDTINTMRSIHLCKLADSID